MPPTDGFSEEKSALRAVIRTKRNALSAEARLEKGEAILRQILADPAITSAGTVYSYISFGSEVPTSNLIRDLLNNGKTVYTPSQNMKAHPLEGLFNVRSYEDGNGFYEPELCTRESSIKDIDVFFVPGMVWDVEGYRIGFGGGFFDRLLAEARPDAYFIGLAFDLQIVEKVPRDPWDIPVHRIATETQWIQTARL